MKEFLASLDQRDRRLLAVSLGATLLLIVLAAVLAPQDDGSNPTPSSYSSQTHGAKAAYLLLERSGYNVKRWTRPLNDLPVETEEHTTLVLAEPYFMSVDGAKEPVKEVLVHGGRVLATGFTGGLVLPGNKVAPNPSNVIEECKAEANGFGAIADSGDVRITPASTWEQTNPTHYVEYTCKGKPVVVTYRFGKGEAIWWANSLPLENTGIERGDNLSLFLRSIGPAAGTHVIWDESLHGDQSGAGLWSYARGTPLYLIWWQLALVAGLLIFSYSRRSGPLRPDPAASRATPIEFVQSLGALYQKAGATNTAVAIVQQRFRFLLEEQLGIGHSGKAGARQIAEAVERRFGYDSAGIERDLNACEEAARGAPLSEKQALALVQALRDHEERLYKQVPSAPDGGRQPWSRTHQRLK